MEYKPVAVAPSITASIWTSNLPVSDEIILFTPSQPENFIRLLITSLFIRTYKKPIPKNPKPINIGPSVDISVEKSNEDKVRPPKIKNISVAINLIIPSEFSTIMDITNFLFA